MKNGRTCGGFLALGLAAITAISACSSSTTEGAVRVALTLTSDPIYPGTVNTTTTRVEDMVWTGLVRYDAKLRPLNANASSISTTDAKTFDIKLNQGYSFSDGTPVNADSYVDAWNWAAYAPHAAQSASFFRGIEGYDAVHPSADGATAAPPPTATTLSGLKKINDYEFQVTLNAPLASFPATLGYSVYYPLPKAFFADRENYMKMPIGNGPYKIEKVLPGQEVDLVRRSDYTHPDAGKAAALQFVNFSDTNAAYTAVQGGQIDYSEVPASALTTFESDFAGRSATVAQAGMMDMQVPLYQPRYQDPKVRQALSMAIDRQGIISSLLAGKATPADGWISPALPGYTPNTCGQACTYDPDKARELWSQARFTGEVILNTQAKDTTIFTAVCQSITNTLKVGCRANPMADATTFRSVARSHQNPGPFRWGWIIDYPTLENMLGPRHLTGGSSNWSTYNSSEFNAAIAHANSLIDPNLGAAAYAGAERILARDLPDIPLYYTQVSGVWSENVSGVVLTGFGWPDLLNVSKKS